MKKLSRPLYTRSKVWIEDGEGNVVFGSGRMRMLRAVKRNGSIHAAARELKMSYRAVWARIHATEERLGASLLEKHAGGASGGGSSLTPLAEELLAEFASVQKGVEDQTDELFREHLGECLNLKNV